MRFCSRADTEQAPEKARGAWEVASLFPSANPPFWSHRSQIRRRLQEGPMAAGLGSSKKLLDLFYDVVSPYSWLAFEVLCRYRPIWNMELRLRPSFLGGIMKEAGNQPPAMVPKRGEYMMKDIPRMAKYYQVPLKIPKDFFQSVIRKGSLPAMRFITAVDMMQPQFLESVCRELWMRIWSQDEDILEPESILAAAERAGVPSDQVKKLLEMSTSPEVKNRLKATTAEALKYGAFGLPCCVAHVNSGPQLIFGSDRLELLANVLGEKWLGPVPAKL